MRYGNGMIDIVDTLDVQQLRTAVKSLQDEVREKTLQLEKLRAEIEWGRRPKCEVCPWYRKPGAGSSGRV